MKIEKSHAAAITLFVIQALGALFLGWVQYRKILVTVQGVSLSNFLLFLVFAGIMLILAVQAYTKMPGPERLLLIYGYAVWVGAMSLIIFGIWQNGSYSWGVIDRRTMELVAVSSVLILIGTTIKGLPLSDPMTRGFLAMAFKALPQCFLAWKIAQEGGGGTPASALMIGHTTILVRIGQSFAELRKDKSPHVLAMLLSELANEASWLAVTACWIAWYASNH